MLRLVRLWRLLEARELDEAALVPLLAEAAETDEERRGEQVLAIRGLLVRAARHPSPRVRRPAVTLLRGAGGFRAREALVVALRDPDSGVRFAAALSCREEMGIGGTLVWDDFGPTVQPALQMSASRHAEIRGLARVEFEACRGDERIQGGLARDESARRAADDLRREGFGASRFWREFHDEKLAGGLEYAQANLPAFLRRALGVARRDGVRRLCGPLLARRSLGGSAEACALAIASQGETGEAVREAVLRYGSRAAWSPRRHGTLSRDEALVLEENLAETPWQSALANAYLRERGEHAAELRRKLATRPLEELLLTGFAAGPVGIPLLAALAGAEGGWDVAGDERRAVSHAAAVRLLDALFAPPGFVGELGEGVREEFQVCGAELLRKALLESPLLEAATRFSAHLPPSARAALGGSTGSAAEPNREGPSFTDLLRAELGRSPDDALLEAACFHPHLAAEAVERLASRGGEERLLRALQSEPPPPVPKTLCDAVVNGRSRAVLDAIRVLVANEELEGERRFHLARGLVGLGEDLPPETFLRAAAQGTGKSEAGWVSPAECDFMCEQGSRPDEVAAALVRSPHAGTRKLGLDVLLRGRPVTGRSLEVLRGYVEEADADADAGFILPAAKTLLANGDGTGIPYLLGETGSVLVRRRKVPIPEQILRVASLGEARAAGSALGNGYTEVEGYLERPVDVATAKNRNALLLELLRDQVDSDLTEKILEEVTCEPEGDATVERLVSCFAWGVREGRRLTKREVSVHLATKGSLGYTTPGESRVFVSPMPILRPEADDTKPCTALEPAGEPYGDVLVKGLILHEIGHHLHGCSAESRNAAEEAAKLGIGRLLNLVEDVFIERAMRKGDPAHGKAFDLLTAWAFQHARCEIPVDLLFERLGDRTLEVLARVPLGRARAHDCVRVDGGRLLLEMERSGDSFARFLRAVRMGRGDRHGDEKVRAGLALFEKTTFRRSTPEARLLVAKRLAEIFGGDARTPLGDFGPPFGRTPEKELRAAAGPISDAVIQAGVARRLAAGLRGTGSATGGEAGAMARLWANLDPSERFDRLERVEKVDGSPDREREAAHAVRPFTRKLRRELEELELGESAEPWRRRLQGRLGRAGLPAAIVRRDPRLLVARARRPARDLFLGLLVDCSGSMGEGRGIEKARLFAALLGEAARGLSGVETRILGFDHEKLLDAGTASRSAAQALVTGGGNNDAGALWHLGLRALESRREAKVVVMISDGLPTACSVAALGAVVRELEKRGVACAQVAVRPLEAVRFRDHTLLETLDPAAAAFGFAGVLSRVVRRALRG